MNNIWFTSDLHFNHDRDFIYGPRGFESAAAMNEQIIHNLHEVVEYSDDLWILGDIIMGDLEAGKKLIKRIPGRIHIIVGNHDSAQRIQAYKDAGFDVHEAGLLIKMKGQTLLLSHFPAMTQNFDLKPLSREVINFHGHTHQESNYTKDQFCMYHVGVDSHNNYPVLFEDAIDDMVQLRKQHKLIY